MVDCSPWPKARMQTGPGTALKITWPSIGPWWRQPVEEDRAGFFIVERKWHRSKRGWFPHACGEQAGTATGGHSGGPGIGDPDGEANARTCISWGRSRSARAIQLSVKMATRSPPTRWNTATVQLVTFPCGTATKLSRPTLSPMPPVWAPSQAKPSGRCYTSKILPANTIRFFCIRFRSKART